MSDNELLPRKPDAQAMDFAMIVCADIVGDLLRLRVLANMWEVKLKYDRQIKLYRNEALRLKAGHIVAYDRTRRYHYAFGEQLASRSSTTVSRGLIRRPYQYPCPM